MWRRAIRFLRPARTACAWCGGPLRVRVVADGLVFCSDEHAGEHQTANTW